MTITLISALPKYITPEEHKTVSASTPTSFADIPPVLRHTEQNVSVTLDPPLDGFSTEDAATGTLYVIESVLVFMSATGRGFRVDYPSITLHAISRAEAGPSIYCQLDEPSTVEDPGDEDDASMRELILIPKNLNSLESIFENLSFCASLHPDPYEEDQMDDDDEDDAFVDSGDLETFNGDEDEELSEVGKAALAHLESIIYDPFDKSAEQFEDAEEGEAQKSNAETTQSAEDAQNAPKVNGKTS